MKIVIWYVLTLLILATIGYLPKASSKVMAVKVVAALRTGEEPDQNQIIADEPIITKKPFHKIDKKEAPDKITNNNAEYLAGKFEVKQR